jgi:hypothetical protein
MKKDVIKKQEDIFTTPLKTKTSEYSGLRYPNNFTKDSFTGGPRYPLRLVPSGICKQHREMVE